MVAAAGAPLGRAVHGLGIAGVVALWGSVAGAASGGGGTAEGAACTVLEEASELAGTALLELARRRASAAAAAGLRTGSGADCDRTRWKVAVVASRDGTFPMRSEMAALSSLIGRPYSTNCKAHRNTVSVS